MPTRADDLPIDAGELAIRAVPLPRETNFAGDVFGGWVLSQMDLAGGSIAYRRAQGRIATIAVASMSFHKPIAIGDEVSIFARIVKEGTTSMTVHIETWVRRGRGGAAEKVTEGEFVYVAIGPDGQKRALPPKD
jgi:acyl-CoA thioesterase YciA